MVFRRIGIKGWCLTFEFPSQELARQAWLESNAIIAELGPNHVMGAYRIRLKEEGPSFLVWFGGEELSEELKNRVINTGRKGQDSDISNAVLLQLFMTYEASRDPKKVTQVHNLRLELLN